MYEKKFTGVAIPDCEIPSVASELAVVKNLDIHKGIDTDNLKKLKGKKVK